MSTLTEGSHRLDIDDANAVWGLDTKVDRPKIAPTEVAVSENHILRECG